MSLTQSILRKHILLPSLISAKLSNACDSTFFRALKTLPDNLDPIPKDVTQDFGLVCLSDVSKLALNCGKVYHIIFSFLVFPFFRLEQLLLSFFDLF